jgi:hypothetical protein
MRDVLNFDWYEGLKARVDDDLIRTRQLSGMGFEFGE